MLGIIDHFSKFCFLVPIKNMSAKTVAAALLNNWIALFGAPLEILSDNGTAFKNLLKQHLCVMMGMKEVFSLPYYPQGNGLVERLFGTAKTMMRLVVMDCKNDWDESLAVVNLALRNSVNRATGYPPYEIIFGKRARLPLDWQFPEMNVLRPSITTTDYIIDLNRRLQQIQTYTRRNLGLEIKRQADYYNKNSLEKKLNVGDKVLVRETRNTAKSKKYKYYGPFTIKRKLGEWTYELVDNEGLIMRRSHNQVKPYHMSNLRAVSVT